MKKLLLTGFICLSYLTGGAQNFSALSFKQAQQIAVKEKKIILVDVTSSRVDKETKTKLEKSVIAAPGTEKFQSENIVAVRVDMGTDEGKEFAPLLQMNMYPTYAFLMPNGDMLGVVSPYLLAKEPELFLKKGSEFMEKAKEKWNNSRKITFSNISFEEALKVAKKENKLLFIDAYTDNCQPCMMMEKNIFTLDKVADFYNKNFINLSLNLGTEHVELSKRYNTFAYPTYLFIDGNGKLIHTGSGYTEADPFIELGSEALTKRGIQFAKGSWSEILELAKKENKPIFVDCFTVWCGPCKMLSAEVFTNPDVADYFNANFINVKIDMEKGEGIQLKEKYQVSAFPTLLYLDKNGEVLNRIVGAMPADKFLEESKKGMSEFGLASLTKRYNSGARDEKFIFDYLKTLESAYLQKDAAAVAQSYLQSLDPQQLKQRQNWALFSRYSDDADSEMFKLLHSNRDEFYNLYGQNQVDNKIFQIWTSASMKFAGGNDGKKIDNNGFKKFEKRLKTEKAKDADLIIENAKLYNAEVSGNWKEFYSIASNKIKKAKGLENLAVHDLFMWGMKIDKTCSDMSVRTKAAQWFEVMAPVVAERDAKRAEEAKKTGAVMAMSMVNYAKEFERLRVSLRQPYQAPQMPAGK